MLSHGKRYLAVFLPICAVLSACGSEPESNADVADILIHNAKIYTVNESRPWAQAAAIRNGRFVYVGRDADLAGIVDGYTKAGAYQLRAENDLGTIEVGKLADLVVLNSNFFELDRTKIHTTAPTAVMLAGELVQGSLR